MNVFQLVKRSVSNRDAAAVYGVDVNCHRFTHCPFHADHTPSLYVADDHYHCYGCEAHGDVIDFTAKFFGISLPSAAKNLAVDFGLHPDLPPANVVQLPASVEERRIERACLQVLQEQIATLEQWYRQYAPETPEDAYDPRFVEACRKLSALGDYRNTLLIGTAAERRQVVDIRLADRRTKEKEESYGKAA